MNVIGDRLALNNYRMEALRFFGNSGFGAVEADGRGGVSRCFGIRDFAGEHNATLDGFSKHCLEPEAWARLRLPRHALHAAHISFHHPGTRERVTFDTPLPEDLADFIAGKPVAMKPDPTVSSA